jgi:rod shape-determining protein MreD
VCYGHQESWNIRRFGAGELVPESFREPGFSRFRLEIMKYLFLAVSSFLAITAQMVAGSNFFLFRLIDVSLLLVAYWAIYRSRTQALFVGSLAGLFLDAALGLPLGYNGFGKTVAAFVIGQSWKKFNTAEQSWVRFAIIASASCLSSLSIGILFWLMQRSSSRAFLGVSFLQALITAGVGTAIFAGIETYKKIQTNKAH